MWNTAYKWKKKKKNSLDWNRPKKKKKKGFLSH